MTDGRKLKEAGRSTGASTLFRTCLLAVALILCDWGIGNCGVVLEVHPDGTGEYQTIQAAVNEALAGDTIRLADGVYVGEGNRDVTFQGEEIVFESASGDPEKCTIRCDGSDADRHNGFRFNAGEGPGFVMRGITVEGGYYDLGGAIILVSGSSPTVLNCVFRSNTGILSGGAINCGQNCSPAFEECLFEGNSAGGGGAIKCSSGGSLSFFKCVFRANSAEGAGAIEARATLSLFISECVFEQNHSETSGGAIYLGGEASLQATECRFIENSAESAGGAIYRTGDGLMTLSEATFISNTAAFAGGGVAWAFAETSLLERCSFVDNSSNWGGGGYCSGNGTQPTLDECTFYANDAAEGGGVYCRRYGSPKLISSIIAFSDGGGSVFCDNSEGLCEPVLSCCDLFGNAGGDWFGCIEEQGGTNANFSLDPFFCDPEAGDLSLGDSSPCAEGNHPTGHDCGTIGAFGVGCQGPTRVEETSWGSVKGMFR